MVDSIENYDRLLRRLEIRRDFTDQITHDFILAVNKTVVGKNLLIGFSDSVIFKKKITVGKTLKLSSEYLNELINGTITLRSRVVSDTSANSLVKRKALNLVEFIQREYHLENE